MFGVPQRINVKRSAEHRALVQRVEELETQLTKTLKHISLPYSYLSFDKTTILGRIEALEEKFAAVLDMCKVQVEQVPTKPAHYVAKRRRKK